jgi:hypothetical protein
MSATGTLKTTLKTTAKIVWYVSSRAIFWGFVGMIVSIIMVITLHPGILHHLVIESQWLDIGPAARVAVFALLAVLLAILPYIIVLAVYLLLLPYLYFMIGSHRGMNKGIRRVFFQSHMFEQGLHMIVDKLTQAIQEKAIAVGDKTREQLQPMYHIVESSLQSLEERRATSFVANIVYHSINKRLSKFFLKELLTGDVQTLIAKGKDALVEEVKNRLNDYFKPSLLPLGVLVGCHAVVYALSFIFLK